MSVCQDSSFLIDKETCSIQHAGLFLDVSKLTRKVDEVTIIIETREIEMLTVEERDVRNRTHCR